MRPADSSTPPVVPRYTPPTLKLPLLISALLLVLLAIGWQLRDPAGSATSADASHVIGDEGDERTEVEAIEAGLAISTIDVVVRAGDSLDRIFRQLELSLQDLAAMRALPELRRQLDRLYPGETLTFSLREGSDTQAAELLSLERKLSLSETLTITRAAEGFSSDVIVNPLERTIHTTEGEILQSLFVAASRAGLSDSMAMQIADVFRWDIDFVLDIRPGDRFRLTYEKLSQDGVSVGDGNLLAVEFVNQGRSYRAIRYERDGQADYYTPDGQSLRKAFLRAPVSFTRISSRFNPYRRHPVLNRMRAHRGVDYAAPTGTPVKAAGSGRVRFVGNKGGYGKVVEIDHPNEVRTLYGHLSRFARGLNRGDKVSQGDVIGYVGMTGLATGPHLHYEYLLRGVHKDPQKVALPNAAPIPESELAAFQQHAAPLLASLDQLSPAPLLAGRRQAGSDRTKAL
jgi:murein DD-endopeptidase MepM/ murein hydrolase activator NlpD